MNEHHLSDHAVAELVRRKCILEVERDTLFDALARLLSHMKLVDAGHEARKTVLICGIPVDDRQLEVDLRHAQLVFRDETDAATARARRGQGAAKALQ